MIYVQRVDDDSAWYYLRDKIEEKKFCEILILFSTKIKKVDVKTLDYYELRCQLVIFSLDVVVQY